MRIEPLYFLLVEEDLQAERFLEGLKRAIVPPEWGPVGWERLSAAASSLPEILGAVRTPALFARPRVEGESASPDKLVVVEEAEKLPPSGWKELASSLREPLPGLCLAFVFRPERPRKWSPPLENTAAVVKKFFRLRGGKLEEWLDAEARGLGGQVEVGDCSTGCSGPKNRQETRQHAAAFVHTTPSYLGAFLDGKDTHCQCFFRRVLSA